MIHAASIQQLEYVLRQEIANALTGADSAIDLDDIKFTLPPDNVIADYAVACFPLAKCLRRPPHAIAAMIATVLSGQPWIAQATAAGPYVNITLTAAAFFGTLLQQTAAEGPRFGFSNVNSGKTFLIEYSSPNTNKPLHVGHLRNNALGMAASNLFEATGANVIRAVIFNDRGIAICKTMVAYNRFAPGQTPESVGVKGDKFVGDLYVKFCTAESEDPSLMEQARDMLRSWEAGEPQVLDLWRTMNQWVYDGLQQSYDRTGCRFDLVQKESDTYLQGREITQNGLKRGIFTQKEDGSVWADLTPFGLDEKVLQRSDGTTVYVTQDLGTAVERFEKYDLDKAIYVVASEQNYHFQVLFKLLELLGYPFATKCHHLSYGMVNLPEGKMKTREGTVIDADDLLDEMRALAKEVMQTSSQEFSADELDDIAEQIGQGAVKYFLLRVNPKKDILFDPRESLAFEGATGAYLQYTHARICSMERKGEQLRTAPPDPSLLGNPEEREVAKHLSRFAATVIEAAEESNPAQLTAYLWQLAKSFNTFYYKHPVLQAGSADLSTARLALASAVRLTLANGLKLLGIDAPQKM